MHGIQKINYNCRFRYYNRSGDMVRETLATEKSSFESAESIKDDNVSRIEYIKLNEDNTESFLSGKNYNKKQVKVISKFYNYGI